MVAQALKLSLLYDGERAEKDGLPIKPTHVESWQSLEPSTSTAAPVRRVAFACPDNTIWITSLSSHKPETASDTTDTSLALPQLIVPTSASSESTCDSRILPASRLSHPGVLRSSSFVGRHRATSSASSILSSTSRRPGSALSPPPTTTSLAAVSATTASADPHAGHDHSSSKEGSELLSQLREQRTAGTTEDDSRLGLGMGGLGRRGLRGVHSKDEIAQQDGGAVSPRSAKSMESARTISTRMMGWMGDDKAAGERERKELMEMVREVEVEREMMKEVEEDKREAEEEKLIEEARRSQIGTPKLQSEGGTAGAEARILRILLSDSARGKIVQMKVDEGMGSLLVLRDIGILDIISLVTLDITHALDLENRESSPKLNIQLSPFWHWRGVHVVQHIGEPLIVAHGLPWPCALPSPNGEVTRVVMLRQARSGELEIVARVDLAGEGDIGIVQVRSDNIILHSTPTSVTSHRITHPTNIIPAQTPTAISARAPQSRSVSATNPSTSTNTSASTPGTLQALADSGALRKAKSSVHLRDAADQHGPYPPEQKERERSLARFLAQRRGDKEDKAKQPPVVVGWGVSESTEVKGVEETRWETFKVLVGGIGVGAGLAGVDIFHFDGEKIDTLHRIQDAKSGGSAVELDILDERTAYLRSENGTWVYRRVNGEIEAHAPEWEVVYQTSASAALSSGGPGMVVLVSEGGMDVLDIVGGTMKSGVIRFTKSSPRRDVDIITPLDVDTCFLADSAGNVSKRKLSDVFAGSKVGFSDSLSSDRMEARVSVMKVIYGRSEYLVAGDEDGVVRIWDAETFELQGSWTLFAFPVQSITLLASPQYGSLDNSILCTSQAGTVGLISLATMEHLYLIPASRVPLRKVYIGGQDIIMAYANGKARVWNYETQEFRRSTGLDAAEDMLNSGDWELVNLNADHDEAKALIAPVSTLPVPSDLGHVLQIDIRELCTFLQTSRTSMSTSPLATLRTILSALIPFGADSEIDRICETDLGIIPPSGLITMAASGGHAGCTLSQASGGDVWRISPMLTGTLQLAIVSLLRMFLDSPDHERAAAQLIAYFTASLPEDSITARLPFFAAFYLDPIADIHQAARMLFECRMDSMSETDFETVVDAHLPELPSFLPSSDQHLEAADLALTMLGGMAVHKFQSMAPGALKAIAESVVIYLNSSISTHLSLAIELASKGFTSWQAFVDPAEMLRRLFLLSTQSSSAPQGSQISAQARLAVLHIASTNPALFMSTLSMDILDAKSVEGRKSIMKLCVYMARKKPEVLENSLPKIVEAVVKSLDPNVGKMREDVQQTATVILNELVLAFSTVDFHSATQKLAVGTHEGALMMYDLKTASRLYILEPHKHPISAVNFSPDGRRLITVSLEEGGLTVWKIGSSLSGFFNVGGPPRQGGKPGEPFKRIEFARADNVPLDSTSALSDVQISWPGLRQAKVLIKETAMTFET